MKSLIGLVLVILGIIVGLYVGLWVCLIGGIVDIINATKGFEPVTAGVIVWDVMRIVFAGLAGWLSAFVFIIPGLSLIKED